MGHEDSGAAQAGRIEAMDLTPRQRKQLEVMMGVIKDAFRANMPTYVKLVQMDAMKVFNAKCDEDGVAGERVEFSHGVLDALLGRIDGDLEAQMGDQFEKLRESVRES